MQWDVADTHGRLRLGEFIRLFIAGTGPHLAEVAWRQAGNVGIAFTRPLPNRVFALLAASEWQAASEAFSQDHTHLAMRRLV